MCDLYPHNDDLPAQYFDWQEQVVSVLERLEWGELSEREAQKKILGICQREVENE